MRPLYSKCSVLSLMLWGLHCYHCADRNFSSQKQDSISTSLHSAVSAVPRMWTPSLHPRTIFLDPLIFRLYLTRTSNSRSNFCLIERHSSTSILPFTVSPIHVIVDYTRKIYKISCRTEETSYFLKINNFIFISYEIIHLYSSSFEIYYFLSIGGFQERTETEIEQLMPDSVKETEVVFALWSLF